MFRIAVCDDEPEVTRQMAEYIKSVEKPCTVDLYSSGESLLAAKKEFDLIFLDIDMKGINGIETARKLRRTDKKVKIIYVSAYPDYASHAFSVHAFGYLLKPVKKEQICRQIREAMDYAVSEEPKTFLRFETDEGLMEFELGDIYYFEYLCRKIQIHTKVGNYWIRGSITELAARMEPHGFCMPHKSFTVNLFYVKSIKGYDIHMMDGSLIPLSQKKSVEFREKLSRFMASQI